MGWGDKGAKSWRKKFDELKLELARREADWMTERAAIISEARAREVRLVEKLVELSGRPPVVIDSTQAIRQIGETISRITQGPPEAVVEGVKLRQEVAENWAAAMRDGGMGDPGQGASFVPFGDVDGFMDPEGARENNQPRDYVGVANGKLHTGSNIKTGRPIEFKAGEGSAPPAGGWED